MGRRGWAELNLIEAGDGDVETLMFWVWPVMAAFSLLSVVLLICTGRGGAKKNCNGESSGGGGGYGGAECAAGCGGACGA